MRNVVLTWILASLLACSAQAAVVADDALLSLVPSKAAADAPPQEAPEASTATCHYRVKRGGRSKDGCRECPQKGETIDSGIPCGDVGACPPKSKWNRLPCPNGDGQCRKVKGKRPRCL